MSRFRVRLLATVVVVLGTGLVVGLVATQASRPVQKVKLTASAQVLPVTTCAHGIDADGNCLPTSTPKLALYCLDGPVNPGIAGEGCTHVVQRLSQIPNGAPWAPGAGGISPREEDRVINYWCREGSESPSQDAINQCVAAHQRYK